MCRERVAFSRSGGNYLLISEELPRALSRLPRLNDLDLGTKFFGEHGSTLEPDSKARRGMGSKSSSLSPVLLCESAPFSP